MANKITDVKRAEMFEAFLEKRSANYVSVKCHIHIRTVNKYRESDKWDSRIAKIEKKTAIRVDNTITRMRARHAKYGQVLQQMFHETFLVNGKLDKRALSRLSKKDLIKALEAGVKMEREAVGEESDENIKIEIKLPKGMSIGHRSES
jgi:hypothetical protein